MTDLPPEVFGRWIHSHEEDTAGTTVYRRSTHPFPPSRGRRGFEIHPDGTFVRHAIAAADGSTAVRGRWTTGGPARIQMTFPDGVGTPETVEVISVDREVLKLRKWSPL